MAVAAESSTFFWGMWKFRKVQKDKGRLMPRITVKQMTKAVETQQTGAVIYSVGK